MHLFINGKEEVLPMEMTLAELIKQKRLNPKTILVEYNGTLIRAEHWEQTNLKQRDRIEILRFVGGG